nr:hypothetical protein [Rosenbergiella epipactidis]
MSCGCACLWLIANGLAVAGNKEKSDSSTTHAAVSDGTIIINDTAKQQQNVDDLSRDVAHANQTLSPIFDKEKEQQRMQTLQLIGEIGNQAADIARTQGEIAGLKAQSDPAALEAARAELMVHGNSHPTSEHFDSKGNFRVVLNLDGSVNVNKTKVAEAERRRVAK